MTTAYTSLLGLALPVTGELSGTWGDTVNNSITSLLDSAIAGTTTLSTDVDVTLTTTTGAANTAREAILLCSGARTGIKTITAPAQSKIYTIINATTGGYAVKIVGAGPTTGLTIPNGSSAVIAWNGSDFIEIGSGTIGNLTVNGNLTVTGTSTLTGAITNTAATANGVMYANGSKVLTTGSALTFDGTNLGIGVTPTQLIEGTAANPRLKLNATSTGYSTSQFANTSGSSYFGRDSSTAGFFGIANGTVIYSSTSDPIGFFLAGSEQMRLNSTGLGIGTSSPAQKLHVSVATVGAGAFMQVSNTGDGQTAYFGTNTAGGSIQVNGAYPLQFATNGSERMRIDSSGNLGLGVTPSAWNSTWKAIQIGAGANFVGRTGVVNQLQLIANGYYNGTNYIYQNTGEATQYFQTGGYHAWGIAPSGTAGNAITFTQAMTLDASGNLLVGTTTSGATGAGVQLWNYTGTVGSTYIKKTASGAFTAVDFRYSGTAVGSIVYTDTATAYNIASDQRLKENIQDAADTALLIDSLQVREFDWKSNGSHQRYGFIAQELVTVAPEAVHQPDNPDDMMAVDYSKLVPMLVKEIQSLRKRLTALEGKA